MTRKQEKKTIQTFRGIGSALGVKFDVIHRNKKNNISLRHITVIFLPLTADIVLKALRTRKVRIPDKFSTPGSIVI